MTNKLLADSIKVNGTEAFFTNEDGDDVDVSVTPLLVSHLNGKLLQLQSNGTLSPEHQMMYQMGEQIGLTTKIVHVRAHKEPSNTWMYVGSISSGVVLIFTLAFVLYKRNKKAKKSYEGVDNEQTSN